MTGTETQYRLRISIVSYSSDGARLKTTLTSLLAACNELLRSGLQRSIDIFLVDNGPAPIEREKLEGLLRFCGALAEPGITFAIVGDGANLGFGVGHNLTFTPQDSDFHLVLNPDVELTSAALITALEFMHEHKDCGLVVPAIFDGDGNRQFLCKRYPSVLDLLVRGFAPRALRGLFEHRLASYEMRDVVGESVVWKPPIVSGCFMLVRSSILKKIGGFDPRYFLYFEDFDLSLRAGEIAQIAYVPSVRIIHHGGHAARKGLRHIYLFMRSAVTFFNRHGWRWY